MTLARKTSGSHSRRGKQSKHCTYPFLNLRRRSTFPIAYRRQINWPWKISHGRAWDKYQKSLEISRVRVCADYYPPYPRTDIWCHDSYDTGIPAFGYVGLEHEDMIGWEKAHECCPYLKGVEISSFGKRELAAHLGLIQGQSTWERRSRGKLLSRRRQWNIIADRLYCGWL